MCPKRCQSHRSVVRQFSKLSRAHLHNHRQIARACWSGDLARQRATNVRQFSKLPRAHLHNHRQIARAWRERRFCSTARDKRKTIFQIVVQTPTQPPPDRAPPAGVGLWLDDAGQFGKLSYDSRAHLHNHRQIARAWLERRSCSTARDKRKTIFQIVVLTPTQPPPDRAPPAGVGLWLDDAGQFGKLSYDSRAHLHSLRQIAHGRLERRSGLTARNNRKTIFQIVWHTPT